MSRLTLLNPTINGTFLRSTCRSLLFSVYVFLEDPTQMGGEDLKGSAHCIWIFAYFEFAKRLTLIVWKRSLNIRGG